VGGDAAVYFDPEDTEAMTQVLRSVADEAARRQAMREAGLARAAQFTWAETARQTLALYERLLS
jgi:glycosyltransferase involved in cell wall biosynthesis